MSSTTVTKMNASAARRGGCDVPGALDCVESAVLQHDARHVLLAAEARRDADVDQYADTLHDIARLPAERRRRVSVPPVASTSSTSSNRPWPACISSTPVPYSRS